MEQIELDLGSDVQSVCPNASTKNAPRVGLGAFLELGPNKSGLLEF